LRKGQGERDEGKEGQRERGTKGKRDKGKEGKRERGTKGSSPSVSGRVRMTRVVEMRRPSGFAGGPSVFGVAEQER
jgi:hypothetical protein